MRSSSREFELCPEDALLVGMRREVAEIVEPAFAGGHDQRMGQQSGQRIDIGVRELVGMMRMHARGRTELRGSGGRELDRAARAVERAAGEHGLAHTRIPGLGHDLRAILIEAVVRQVEPDIDQQRLHGHAARRASVTGSRAARSAGNRPPTRPMPSAHLMPFHSSSGDTLNWNITWLKFELSVETV